MASKGTKVEADWKRQYELLLNSLPDAVLLFDSDGTLIACNEAASGLTGIPHEQLLGMQESGLLEIPKTTDAGGLLRGELVTHDRSRVAVEIRRSVQVDGAWPDARQYLV